MRRDVVILPRKEGETEVESTLTTYVNPMNMWEFKCVYGRQIEHPSSKFVGKWINLNKFIVTLTRLYLEDVRELDDKQVMTITQGMAPGSNEFVLDFRTHQLYGGFHDIARLITHRITDIQRMVQKKYHTKGLDLELLIWLVTTEDFTHLKEAK